MSAAVFGLIPAVYFENIAFYTAKTSTSGSIFSKTPDLHCRYLHGSPENEHQPYPARLKQGIAVVIRFKNVIQYKR